MDSLKSLIAIAIAAYLLFFGGCEAVQKATSNYTQNGNPVVPAITKGIERLQNTPRVVVSTPGPVIIRPAGMPPLPRATPQPAPVQGQAQATPAQVEPSATPVPASDSFWSEADQAAFTATADAFYTDVPQAPAEFVEYAQNACATATVKSPLCP